MKKQKSWSDSRYNIQNTLYEFSNGIKFLHSINPASKDLVFSAAVRAGASFEPDLGLPTGTAHFLEHMMMNPNKKYKTQKEIDAFEFGDRARPRLEVNAATSHKYMYFFGYTNMEGEKRLLERIRNMLNYPVDFFDKNIEIERKVILAEIARMFKPEKDPEYMYDLFLVGDEMPHFANRIIGTTEEVESLTAHDLREFHEATLLKDATVFSIQSGKELSASMKDQLTKMAGDYDGESNPISPKEESLKNEYHYTHLHDDREHGVFVSFNYFQKDPKEIRYVDKVFHSMLTDLLRKRGYDTLREEMGLVYAFETFRFSYLAFEFDVWGFKCSAETHKFSDLLEALQKFIYTDLMKFLKSSDGQGWFDHSVSRYIFPNTPSYDESYAEGRSLSILEGREIYLFDEAVKVAKKLKRKDLISYIEKNLLKPKPHVWISSSEKDSKILGKLKKSDLHKQLTK